jgi:hypothetical protein
MDNSCTFQLPISVVDILHYTKNKHLQKWKVEGKATREKQKRERLSFTVGLVGMLVTRTCKLAKKQVISNAALPERKIFCSQNVFLTAEDIANGEMVFVLDLKHVSA